MSGQHVVVATEIGSMQQLLKIVGWAAMVGCWWVFLGFCTQLRIISKARWRLSAWVASYLNKRRKMGKNGQEIRQDAFPSVSANRFWLPDNGNGIFIYLLYVSVYVTGYSWSALPFCKYSRGQMSLFCKYSPWVSTFKYIDTFHVRWNSLKSPSPYCTG